MLSGFEPFGHLAHEQVELGTHAAAQAGGIELDTHVGRFAETNDLLEKPGFSQKPGFCVLFMGPGSVNCFVPVIVFWRFPLASWGVSFFPPFEGPSFNHEWHEPPNFTNLSADYNEVCIFRPLVAPALRNPAVTKKEKMAIVASPCLSRVAQENGQGRHAPSSDLLPEPQPLLARAVYGFAPNASRLLLAALSSVYTGFPHSRTFCTSCSVLLPG